MTTAEKRQNTVPRAPQIHLVREPAKSLDFLLSWKGSSHWLYLGVKGRMIPQDQEVGIPGLAQGSRHGNLSVMAAFYILFLNFGKD